MKVLKVTVENFRGYKESTTLDIGDLTALIGKNDVGKSSILEALDIFFNDGKGPIKLDKNDINKQGEIEGNNDISIGVTFGELPPVLVLDATYETTLAENYLLNEDGKLEIIKRYPNAGKEKVYIRAKHPANIPCTDLLSKKQSELRSILSENKIECGAKTKNAEIRKAIWCHFAYDLQLAVKDVDVSKEDAKNIWERLKEYMPLYALFQSDRKNSDGDSEIQDPMKFAVQTVMKEAGIRSRLQSIADDVRERLNAVATSTLAKLQEMNPEISNTLNPVIPLSEDLKWAEVFKNVSITGDQDIPINKRGSGVKRLVLLNFFRAEAERRKCEKNVTDIIFAIEEPETSQHPDHQRKLIGALRELSNTEHCQILLTTHSPAIVKLLDFANLKMIKAGSRKEVVNIQKSELPYPSLNEVNYLAFDEADEEYHNELFGHLEETGDIAEFEKGKPRVDYLKQFKGKDPGLEKVTRTRFIRHQIHHPENKLNERFTGDALHESIHQMREFIETIGNRSPIPQLE